MHQMMTSPNCSVTLLTLGSGSGTSSEFSAFLALAAAAKLKVDLTLAATALLTRGEGGTEVAPVDVGVLGPWRSEPVRELVRDIGCCARRSLVASRSLSIRSVTAFSFAVTSTGLSSRG